MGAIVQTKENSASGSATTIASGSTGSNVTSGNKLWIVANAGTNVTITPSQNSGTATLGTITSQGSIQEAGVLDKLEHFTCDITGTGSLDILITYGSSTDRRGVVAVEVSGVSAVDGSDEQTDTGSNPTTTCTVNVTTQPAFGIGFCTDYQGGTPTAGASWTDGGVFWSGVSNARLQTRAISATGNVTGNFGNAGSNRNNAVMIVFTDGGGGSGSSILVPPSARTTPFLVR
jgi:hypothetical protein